MKNDKDVIKYMWKSQYYEFGNYMKKLHDIVLTLDLPHKQKNTYLTTVKSLYNDCEKETLTWENIQSGLFIESDLMDVLVEQAGPIGEKLKEDIAFQYVCIQMEQWREEENND